MEPIKDVAVPRGGPRRVIKRYSNRKLYDTRDSRYVTLQQIGEMVRAGEEVQIIDNKTKEDKTEVTLALILSEDLRSEPKSVPLGTLRDLIQERGGRLLDQLREGRLGRFMTPAEQKASAEAEAAEATRAEERRTEEEERREDKEKKGRFSGLMESSLSSFDERIRAIVPSAKSFAELREQVVGLEARVLELSAEIEELKRRR